MFNYCTLYLLLLCLLLGWAAADCGASALRLRLRSVPKQPDELEQLDLSKLSAKQLKQLQQQLNSLEEQQLQQQLLASDDELQQDYQAYAEEAERGGKRPWNKVQRIIRRQLVRIPKRYLKKFLREWGLARSSGSSMERSGANFYLYELN